MPETEQSFDQILIMQCFGAEDTFTLNECKQAVKKWLEQKKGEFWVQGNTWVIKQLLEDLEK